MRKMYNAQKKPMDSLKEQLDQLLEDLGQASKASKSPKKNKKANNGVAKGQQVITGFANPLKRELEDAGDFE